MRLSAVRDRGGRPDARTWRAASGTNYELAAFTDVRFRTNTLIAPSTAPADFSDSENPASIFGKSGNTITALQARGVAFLACLNAIWEIEARLIDSGRNPDQKSHEALAAELTKHLVEGVVLTPGITATILELQQAGFHYATYSYLDIDRAVGSWSAAAATNSS
jgi:intracellular sulfur oxidation DsrE/DsrF family protein